MPSSIGERRRFRRVQNFDLLSRALRFRPSAMFGLYVSGSRSTTLPRTASTYSLRARSAIACASFEKVRVEHDLHDAGPVAQVDEQDAAEVAAALHPAVEHHRLCRRPLSSTFRIDGFLASFVFDSSLMFDGLIRLATVGIINASRTSTPARPASRTAARRSPSLSARSRRAPARRRREWPHTGPAAGPPP